MKVKVVRNFTPEENRYHPNNCNTVEEYPMVFIDVTDLVRYQLKGHNVQICDNCLQFDLGVYHNPGKDYPNDLLEIDKENLIDATKELSSNFLEQLDAVDFNDMDYFRNTAKVLHNIHHVLYGKCIELYVRLNSSSNTKSNANAIKKFKELVDIITNPQLLALNPNLASPEIRQHRKDIQHFFKLFVNCLYKDYC